ncbi:unnamed protein product [Effrenium voratum]|nr:unnamed protein product [Effrenium voratum]
MTRPCGNDGDSCGPFPNVASLAAAYVAFSSVLTVPVLFPLVGFMVLEFGVAERKEDAGYMAGFLASCFMIGRTLSAAPCGLVADRHGVVRVLLFCTLASSLGTILVGLVETYWAAVALRIATGLANPIVALLKGLMPNLVPHHQQHRAMSMLTAQWQFGLIVGPALSGYLAYPCGHEHPLGQEERGLMCTRPFLLPTLFCGLLQLSGILPLLSILRPAARKALPQSPRAKPPVAVLGKAMPSRDRKRYDRLEEPEVEDTCDAKAAADSEPASPSPTDTVPVREDVLAANEEPDGCGWNLVRLPNCALLLFLYCFVSMMQSTLQELASLLVMTPDHAGGLGGSTSDIGAVFTAVGGSGLLFQLTLGPALVERIGLVRSFQAGMYLSGVFALLMPMVPFAMQAQGLSMSWQKGGLTAVMICRGFSDYLTFTGVFVLINNCVPTYGRCRINGLAMSLASTFKALGPAVGTVVFAWSINSAKTPDSVLNGLLASIFSPEVALRAGAPLVFILVSLGTLAGAFFGARAVPVWAEEPYDLQATSRPDALPR